MKNGCGCGCGCGCWMLKISGLLYSSMQKSTNANANSVSTNAIQYFRYCIVAVGYLIASETTSYSSCQSHWANKKETLLLCQKGKKERRTNEPNWTWTDERTDGRTDWLSKDQKAMEWICGRYSKYCTLICNCKESTTEWITMTEIADILFIVRSFYDQAYHRYTTWHGNNKVSLLPTTQQLHAEHSWICWRWNRTRVHTIRFTCSFVKASKYLLSFRFDSIAPTSPFLHLHVLQSNKQCKKSRTKATRMWTWTSIRAIIKILTKQRVEGQTNRDYKKKEGPPPVFFSFCSIRAWRREPNQDLPTGQTEMHAWLFGQTSLYMGIYKCLLSTPTQTECWRRVMCLF